MEIIGKIVIIGFLLSPILDIIAVNRLRKYKKENAELKMKFAGKENEENESNI